MLRTYLAQKILFGSVESLQCPSLWQRFMLFIIKLSLQANPRALTMRVSEWYFVGLGYDSELRLYWACLLEYDLWSVVYDPATGTIDKISLRAVDSAPASAYKKLEIVISDCLTQLPDHPVFAYA